MTTIEPLIKKVLAQIDLECPICFDQIKDSVTMTDCCTTFYHSNCFNNAGGVSCQFCDEKNPNVITCHFDLLKIISSKFGSEKINLIMNQLCNQDQRLFYHIDSTLRHAYGPELYSEISGGTYQLEKQFNPVDFKSRLDEFSFGILSNFKFNDDVVFTGSALPLLVAGNLFYIDHRVPIHLLVFNDNESKVSARISEIISYLKTITELKYAQQSSLIFIEMKNIARQIIIEAVVSEKKLNSYLLATNYSKSKHFLCQGVYNGKSLQMTGAAINTLVSKNTNFAEKADPVDMIIFEHLEMIQGCYKISKPIASEEYSTTLIIDYALLFSHIDPVLVFRVNPYRYQTVRKTIVHLERSPVFAKIKHTVVTDTDVNGVSIYITKRGKRYDYLSNETLIDFIQRHSNLL